MPFRDVFRLPSIVYLFPDRGTIFDFFFLIFRSILLLMQSHAACKYRSKERSQFTTCSHVFELYISLYMTLQFSHAHVVRIKYQKLCILAFRPQINPVLFMSYPRITYTRQSFFFCII